jgi:hypothetical protein
VLYKIDIVLKQNKAEILHQLHYFALRYVFLHILAYIKSDVKG